MSQQGAALLGAGDGAALAGRSGGTLVLRFAATTIRIEPGRVAAQLERALGIERV